MMRLKKKKATLLPLFFFLVIHLALSSFCFATGFTYNVSGNAYSDADMGMVNLSGFMKIDIPAVSENYIESVFSSNANSFEITYNIIDSHIKSDSNETFSSGAGNIYLSFLKTWNGTWDNYSTWQCGNIQTSLCEGDVYFENKNLVNLNDYDILPSKMMLNFGMIFNQYNSIDLSLTRDISQTPNPVPEPGSIFLLIAGLPYILKIRGRKRDRK